MPKLWKLTQFKDAAKDLISGDIYKDWENFNWVEAEEDVVRAWIKKISADSGIDFSPLYSSIAKERQEQARHKENVDLYTKYRFLKRDEAIEKMMKEKEREEFEFPTQIDWSTI